MRIFYGIYCIRKRFWLVLKTDEKKSIQDAVVFFLFPRVSAGALHVIFSLRFLLTYWGWAQTTFPCSFSCCISLKNSLKWFPIINNKPALISDNGLVPDRRQAIISNKGGLVNQRIYVSLGLDVLIHWGLNKIAEMWFQQGYSDIKCKYKFMLFQHNLSGEGQMFCMVTNCRCRYQMHINDPNIQKNRCNK